MRALILTTNTGGGHNAAADALREALEMRSVETRTMDCVAFGGRWLTKTVSGTYVRMVQHSTTRFGRMYRLCEMISTPRIKSPVYRMNSAYAFRMKKILREYRPDMVICTHLFGGQSVTHLKRHGYYNGLLAMVMTDYTYAPFMVDVQAEILTLAHPDVLEQCIRQRIDPATIVKSGIPVSLRCMPCNDKRQAKIDAGLDPDEKLVLVIGGSMGAGGLPRTMHALRPALGEQARLMVICGSNRQAMEEAKAEWAGDPSVTVLGSVRPLYSLMAASDVIVSKCGGLTSSELMTIGLPMVIYQPIVGCETENAALFERHGMALWAHDEKQLTAYVRRLLTDEAARERMIRAQREQINPHAAIDAADAMIAYVKAHPVQ